MIEVQTQRLSENAYILSSDFGFKQVIATQDRMTILSALDNLRSRIGADAAVLVSLQNKVLADTAHPDKRGLFFAPKLIQRVQQQGEANDIVLIDNTPHQMVVVPVMAPEVKAWLCISFKISQIQVDELQQLTQSHISLILAQEGEAPILINSSLPEISSQALLTALPDFNLRSENSHLLELDETRYITSILDLSVNRDVAVIAVLQKSLDKELIPFYRLQWFLIALTIISLSLALFGSLLVARSVSRPIKSLVTGVREVAKGHYDYRIVVDRADEIGELGSAFNDMATRQGLQEALRLAKESAENANQAKTDFLANMSHELRTPLNSILGYAQLLKKHENNTAQQNKALHTIEQSGQHLLSLINEILDLSKIEAGQMELQPVELNLKVLLHNITEIMQARAASKGLELRPQFEFNAPAWVNIDEQRLRQILMNLLDNAIKYTQTGMIDFKVKRVESGRYRFAVEDTGIGIRPEHLDEIFTSFHQLHQTKDYVEGTGLGLAISNRLVQLMGGKLDVTSEPGSGSQFWFELELAESNQSTHSQKALPFSNKIIAMTGTSRKILIVDDKTDNRVLLRDLLAPFEFEITEASDGKTCISQAQKGKPDIILMDSRMPVMDGIEACRHIRDIAVLKDIVIILISANVFESHRQLCIEAGANDFLAKPFQLDTLLIMIARYTDLELCYETENFKPVFTEANAAISNRLPPRIYLERLLELAKQGDIKAINQQADEIRLLCSDYTVFLQQISKFIDSFQLKKIRALLTRAISETRHI